VKIVLVYAGERAGTKVQILDTPHGALLTRGDGWLSGGRRIQILDTPLVCIVTQKERNEWDCLCYE
jgi:hypothetical protein